MADDVAVDETLRALAHPARRAMLRLVWDAERSSSDLADAVGMSRPAASQHLKALREAGLVHVRVDGNQRLYRVDLERLAAVRSQLEGFWGERLGRLAAEVTGQPRGPEGSGRGVLRWEGAQGGAPVDQGGGA
jgi:DNA-binding transcriptional ArsR family regulator